MVRQYVGATKFFSNLLKGGTQKTTGTGTISSVDIAENLAKKKTIKDEMIKARDKQLAGVRDEAKVEIKSKTPFSNQVLLNRVIQNTLFLRVFLWMSRVNNITWMLPLPIGKLV